MNIVYQIKSHNTVAYAKDIASCDNLCAIIIGNGYPPPTVRRMKRSDVPLSDIEMLNEL